MTRDLEKPYTEEINYEKVKGFEKWLKDSYGMSISGVFKFSIQRLCRQTILQRFFREVHKIHVDVYRSAMGWQCNLEKAECGTHMHIVSDSNDDLDGIEYEDAQQQGLLNIIGLKCLYIK
ncbi:hypothetical protein HYO65_gp086 [Tenacibaculum phage PTm1]|uniref:Uncharacterized protein n=2 Tax=Shirahamavirus PTm1 TaxID=2846435 RepID=A0A5S9EQR3_9CAUD|nr:hypothetical protein HYO65_gp086 [Tenacibaculum phage PTm1]BBI90478.1 hypothetical protein [Tenacibaculum phage PTm1]BBI90786.1 hypothetical protein [Tenacibaculum phage PTm5]